MSSSNGGSGRAKKAGRCGTPAFCFFGFLLALGAATLVATTLYHHVVPAAEPSHSSPLELARLREYQSVVDMARASIERHQLQEKAESIEPLADPDLRASLRRSVVARASSSSSSSRGVVKANSSSSGRPDLVLGMAQNTDPKNIAVFCKSLRQVSSAEAILFINEPIPDRHKEIAQQNGVTLRGFAPNRYGEASGAFHPSTLRWALFQEFFQPEHTRARYERVWLIDVRDSYFQRDPFEMLPVGESALYTFNGVESITLGQCGWNSGWVKDCFGQAVLSEIASKRIICSGVTMGDAASVLSYLAVMDDVIMNKRKTAIGQSAKFPSCERNGVDQGVHNVIVHKNAVPGVRIEQWSQGDGPVMNMQAKKATVTGSDKIVTNSRGAVAAVVHQYDRDEALQRHLFAKYVDWVNTADPRAEWLADAECAKYGYVGDFDSFKGVCDYKMQGGATSPASCCGYCNKAAGCRGFTFYGGKCFLKNCDARGGAGAPLKSAVSGVSKHKSLP